MIGVFRSLLFRLADDVPSRVRFIVERLLCFIEHKLPSPVRPFIHKKKTIPSDFNLFLLKEATNSAPTILLLDIEALAEVYDHSLIDSYRPVTYLMFLSKISKTKHK